MSILINKHTRLLVQGITGNEGLFHTEQMLAFVWWHARAAREGHGTAGQFAASGGGGVVRLAWLLAQAHLVVLWQLPRLLRERAAIRRKARISAGDFLRLLEQYSISAKEIARL